MMHFTSAMPNVPNSFYVQVICSIEQHNKHQYGLFVEPLKFKFNDVSIIDQPIILNYFINQANGHLLIFCVNGQTQHTPDGTTTILCKDNVEFHLELNDAGNASFIALDVQNFYM